MVTPRLRQLTLATLAIIGFEIPSAFAQAEDEPYRNPWYQFEMLIFSFDESHTQEQLRKTPFTTEALALKAGREFDLGELFHPKDVPDTLDPDQAIQTVITADGVQFGVESLVEEPLLMASIPEERVLNEYAQMLRYRRPYTVRYHRAWQQPLPPHSEVRKYNFSAGVPVLAPPSPVESAPVDDQFSVVELSSDITPYAANQSTSASQQALPPAIDDRDRLYESEMPLSPYQQALQNVESQPPYIRQLQGSVYVYRKAYAHMIFDLWFAEIDPLVAPQSLRILVELPEQPISDDPTMDAEQQAESVFTALSDGNDIDRLLDAEITEPAFELHTEDAYTARRFGHIHEDRRMRSGEMYYVDHPLFGIVLKMEKMPHPLDMAQRPFDAASTP